VIEIEITKIDGTLKMGQSGSHADREYAAQALTKLGTDEALATAYLTRSCEKERPMQGLHGEMENATKERNKKVGNANQVKWWDICVGTVLIAVPLLAYRLFLIKR
jgi:hypothetical protein